MKPVFEHVRHPASASFACHRFEGAAFDCPYHVHPEVEILHIEASGGRFLAGDHAGRFNAGDLFVFGPGLPHMFCNDEAAGARSSYLQFREDCFGEGFFGLPELRVVAGWLKRSARGMLYRRVRGLAERFEAVAAAQGAAQVAELLRLLGELARGRSGGALASEGYVPVASTRSSERLERALTHINRGLFAGEEGGVDLAGTARAAAMSPEAFSRFFRCHLGKTFQDYLTDLRVAEACRLLLDTDRTVADVCFQAGFNNLANFNRHFLRRKGVNPRTYRMLSEREPA